MTTFQLVCFGIFMVVVCVAYRKEIANMLKFPVGNKKETKPSIAVKIVDDILAVTELRDKLAAEGCTEGVDACTALLRVIVEHTRKNTNTQIA